MATAPPAVRRVVLRLSSTTAGARVMRVVLPALDRLAHRLTGGRHTVTELVLPTLVLTATGRRSGLPRTQPLAYVEVDDGWAVAGSNFGQEHHPAWTNNLLADPSATVSIDGGRQVDVVARLLAGEERERTWARFTALAPNYARYEQRVGDREIRVFVLEPADA